jgi:hypothetical protein
MLGWSMVSKPRYSGGFQIGKGLDGVARRERLLHGKRVCLGYSSLSQSSLELGGWYVGHEGTNYVFLLCDCTAGRFSLVQNHDDVLCHKYQAVIVSPINGGTNYCMMAV